MDAYELPEEFAHLQAQDMSKIGFINDVVRGVKKVVSPETKETPVVVQTQVSEGANSNVNALLERGFMALEDGEWKKADDFFEQALNFDAKLADAYLGKLMAELHVNRKENLKDCAQPFEDRNNYQKTIRFGDEAMKKELDECISFIYERNENARLEGIYDEATETMEVAESQEEYEEAAELFESISHYKDSAERAKKCRENAEIARKDAVLAEAEATVENFTSELIDDYEEAIKLLKQIPGWKNADELIIKCDQKIEEIRARLKEARLEKERKDAEAKAEAERIAKRNKKIAIITTSIVCALIAFWILWVSVIQPNINYNKALSLMEAEKYEEAISVFEAMDGYKESVEKIAECETGILDNKYDNAIVLLNSGNKLAALQEFQKISSYKDSCNHIKNLINSSNAFEILSAGYDHTIGLKSDGTVVAVGDNDNGQCNVKDWKDIVAVSAGDYYTVGLKSDGTVVAVGNNDDGKCSVEDWKDIIAVSAGNHHTVGLKSDGTVVATKFNHSMWHYDGQCDVEQWKDIVAVSAGDWHTVGLKSDGTVVAVGDNDNGQCNVRGWKDIVSVSAGGLHTIGLKSDGTVVAVGDKSLGQCNVGGWTDIVAVSAEFGDTVGLKLDGTVVCEDSDVEDWKDIVAVSAGAYHTVGLKSDGTVVAVGYNDDGQCNVKAWPKLEIEFE